MGVIIKTAVVTLFRGLERGSLTMLVITGFMLVGAFWMIKERM